MLSKSVFYLLLLKYQLLTAVKSGYYYDITLTNNSSTNACGTALDNFIKSYKNNDFLIQDIALIKANIYANNFNSSMYAINEVVVKGDKSRTVHLTLDVNGKHIQIEPAKRDAACSSEVYGNLTSDLAESRCSQEIFLTTSWLCFFWCDGVILPLVTSPHAPGCSTPSFIP